MVTRMAKSKTDKAASGAGSFLGGLTNNPGAVAIAVILGALFLFRNQITSAFGSLGETIGGGLGDINVNLPSFDLDFPDFNFPDFNFPDFNIDFGDPFANIQESIDKIVDQFSNPDQPGREEGSTPDPDVIPDTTGGLADRQQAARDAIAAAEAEAALQDTFDDQFFGDAELVRIANEQEFRDRQLDPIINNNDILSPFQVQSGIEDQIFGGGGLSFVGGSVSEIPIERLSLGQIIDQFDVTASQAANLRAIAQGFTPEEESFLNIGQELSPLGDFSSEPQTSQGFEGLTPEQIFLRLTGGIISNF